MKKIYETPFIKIASVDTAGCTMSVESNKGTWEIGAKQRGTFYEEDEEENFWSTNTDM